ncbi:MAG TPA: TetR/AcrR family transcriptional regulator [Firmicutes bacterium]|nr:TetR/AcrR family transcriptional regulator [Bacillota bacterium]
MNTKDEILKVAIELFNEKGYHQVKMRDISQALNISVGNVTYHYKKKQMILNEIMNQSFELLKRDKVVESFQDYFEFNQKILQTIEANKFYFNNKVIYDEHPEFLVINQIRRDEIKHQYIQALKQLRYHQLITMEDDVLDVFIVFTLLSHIGWLQEPMRAEKLSVEDCIRSHLVLLAPYCTKSGLKALEEL